MNQTEFAKHIGVTQGYIAQLKNAGRLVMQGSMVNVDESKKLITDTKDPGKAGVEERHQKEREQKQDGKAASAQTGPAINDMTRIEFDDAIGRQLHQTMDDTTTLAGSAYQKARAMREKYNAMQAKIAYEKEVGLLLVAHDVKLAVADGDAIIRNRLESMPEMLAPQLAAISDEQKIRAMLADQVEYLLGELSRTFYGMTK
jgi:hypothetical protein